jgi:hypothetical protein
MYIHITIHEHSEKQEVRQYAHSRTPRRNLQPDSCGPVLPLATNNLDFTPNIQQWFKFSVWEQAPVTRLETRGSNTLHHHTCTFLFN